MGIAILFAAAPASRRSVIAIGLIAMPSMLNTATTNAWWPGHLLWRRVGLIIPPSIMLIIYGPVAGVSISLLFFAAMLPGVLMGITYILYMASVCYIWPTKAPATKEERAEYSKKDIAKLLLVAACRHGLILLSWRDLLRFAAPTEAAALGSVGAFAMVVGYGKFNFKMLRDSCYSSLGISSFIMWLVLGAKFS